MLIGNWKDRRMVEWYMHLGDETLAAAMETLDATVSRRSLSQSPICHGPSADKPEDPAAQPTVN